MNHRSHSFLTMLVFFSSILVYSGITNSAFAEEKSVSDKINGKVTHIIDVPSYTYAEVDTGEKKIWAAGPTTPLIVGDKVTFSTRMPMKNFHSKSIKRDFAVIYFIDKFVTERKMPANKHTKSTSRQNNPQQKTKPIAGIKKVEGGETIADIYTNKKNLQGKMIRVRGKVTKFSKQIMGKNWLHIRDSSTLEDLTITTDGVAEIDDVVVIEGKLELDKDFGYGYVYAVILQNAKITEK